MDNKQTNKQKQLEIDFNNEEQIAESYLNNIEQINVVGSELLLGKIYDEVGFNEMNEPLLKQLVMSRLCYSVSKLRTTDYLNKYHSIYINVDKIYR